MGPMGQKGVKGVKGARVSTQPINQLCDDKSLVLVYSTVDAVRVSREQWDLEELLEQR